MEDDDDDDVEINAQEILHKVFTKGPWTSPEDEILVDYIQRNGEGNWKAVEKNSGLSRSGMSCRTRWRNHLRPDLKKCSFSEEEERRMVELRAEYGNKWARIATELPGRTDRDVRNFWRTKGVRTAGKPIYPSGIVPEHSTETGEFDLLDRHTSGRNHLDLLQEGNLEIPLPNLDIAKLQRPHALPCSTSSLHEVPPLCLTRRNCPSDAYNSYPFANASEMNEILSADQYVYSPEVVSEPLVEPSPQSLAGPSSDNYCFGQPLSDGVPGSPDISNYDDFDYSKIFSEPPKLEELPPFQYPDACLSSQSTPAADHPHRLNQSPPAHPSQPAHPSSPSSNGLLEETCFSSLDKGSTPQIIGFSTGVVPAKDINQRSYSPLGGNASFMPNAFSVHENSAKENQSFDEDASVAGFLNDNEEPDDTDNSRPGDDVLNSSWFRQKF